MWDEHIQLLAGAIRATIHRRTGFSANMMMYGRELIQPVGLMFGTFSNRQSYDNVGQYVHHLRKGLETVHALARQHLESSQALQKKDHNFKLKQKMYEMGDLVYQLDSATKVGQSSKLKPVWKGPFLIIKAQTLHIYVVGDSKKQTVVHHDRLKLCEDWVLPMWLVCKRHELIDSDEEQILKTEDGDMGLSNLFKESSQQFNLHVPTTKSNQDLLNDDCVSEIDSGASNVCMEDHKPLKETGGGRKVKPPVYFSY